MNILQAIILGLVQGLTEFLPVSSSGHLAILQNVFKMNTDTGVLFETMLHLGTLVAVCIVFWNDVKNLVIHGIGLIKDVCINVGRFVKNKTKDKDDPYPYQKLITNAYRKFAALIIVTSVPTAFLGFLLRGLIEKASSTLIIPGICLLITAIILLVTDGRPGGSKKAKGTTYKDAAMIGVAQGIATMPGISRSGATISACIFLGMDRAFAVKYSFLASLPAIVGANLLELRHIGETSVTASLIGCYFVGMIVAGVVGFLCIKFMIGIVKRSRYEYFAYYCGIIGVISICCYFILE